MTPITREMLNEACMDWLAEHRPGWKFSNIGLGEIVIRAVDSCGKDCGRFVPWQDLLNRGSSTLPACEWRQDASGWHASCGHFTRSRYTVETFCPKCGRRIVEVTE